MSLEATASTWTPRMLSVLRIMTGLLFLQHGTWKFLGLI
jgi:putative oxidoreductase